MVATASAAKWVLIIDDDFATREMVSHFLAGAGYRVCVACNGADAIECLRHHERPDVILLDVKMPVMDGCAFCQQKQRDPELAGIPLIVVSAIADSAEVTALGARARLQKPFDTIQLLAALRECGL
jgi:two-component system cell cycle response regulator